MADETSYQAWLKQDLGGVIDSLDLSDLQHHFLRSRWLEQVLWMEGKAATAQKRYYLLRLVTIIGGVIVPALVSSSLPNIRWLIVILSLLVAISAAVEEFFHYGERWRHYRRTVELLKIEGWQFFLLSGGYRDAKSHVEAYPTFAARVEETMQQDLEVFVTKIVQEQTAQRDKATVQ